MSRQRFVLLTIAALIAIAGAFYLSSQRYLPRDPRGTPLLPGFGAELDTVTAVTLRKGAGKPALSLRKTGGTWSIAERNDYPADVSKLRRLLLSLSDAMLVEEKTSNPANYAAIGVDDPAGPDSAAAEITVYARDGRHSLIVGKPVGNGNFVRRVGEEKSYAAEPAIAMETEPRTWIDAHLIDIPVVTIARVAVKPAAGPAYVIHRSTRADDGFALDAVPAGRTPLDPKSIGPSPIAYGNLTADDVAPAGSIDFGNASVAAVSLTDGTTITFTGTAATDKRWISLQSSKESVLAPQIHGRAYEIAGYRYDAIFRPLEQLLSPKPVKPTAAASKPTAAKPPKPKP